MFYTTHDQHFPSESEERTAYRVGSGEHCGHAMTHKPLDHETQKFIYGGAARPQKSTSPNHRLAPHGEEVPHLLTLLKIKFHLDRQCSHSRATHQSRRSLQSSSGLEMIRIHLDPSLCQLFTQKISLGGHFFCLLKEMVKGTEPNRILSKSKILLVLYSCE